MIKIKINDTLILANNNFVNNKKETIKEAKVIIKKCKYFTFA